MTTTVDFGRSDGPAVAVVSAVASELGVDSEDLDAPLHDYVDPDALAALFAPTRGGVARPEGKVVFRMHGCEVTVRGSGEVSVERLADHRTVDDRADESHTPS